MVTVKDTLLDLLEFTNNEFFDCVKIIGSDKETLISASDGEPTLILNARTKEPSEELIGTLGLGSLSILSGLFKLKNLRNSTVEVMTKNRNGIEYAEMFNFVSDTGTEASYRLMHESALPDMPVFKGTTWDIEFTPKKDEIEEFGQLASLMGDIESQFNAKVIDNNLVFYIGEESASSHKVKMIFEVGVNGSVTAGLKWPCRQVLYALRACVTGNRASDPIMKISNKGVICISIDSGLGEYDFYIVAKQK